MSAHRNKKRMLALAIWGAGILIFLAIWKWNYDESYRDLETRLVADAGYQAAQLARLLTIPEFELDNLAINAIVSAAMEDESVYAVKVELANGELEGQRRNYLWEPVPWDNEVAENSVQGRNTLKLNGKPVGQVEVWLSSRQIEEEHALQVRREAGRLAISCFLWTLAFIFMFWLVGDFARLKKHLLRKQYENRDPELRTREAVEGIKQSAPKENQPMAVNMELGRQYQKRDQDSWFIMAGMFRQTFSRGPDLINRLFAEGETAGLCHLGRIIEQAAPCMGAEKLQKAAANMQAALNNPENELKAGAVEECAAALQEALDALGGKANNRRKG